jgi:hypothetical protein
MPRRNKPSRAPGGRSRAAGDSDGFSSLMNQRTESWNGVDYLVRHLAGTGSAGPYRCPGCDQLLPASTPHVVAWPEHDIDADHRRHWHTPCWSARDRRAPVRFPK